MEGNTQITLDQWTQWKEDIRSKLTETAGNFVYIGYRLKQIRDSGMYDGAADVFEFAQKEYGIGKSTVSRFIAINEKYSEGGNSLELREEFKNFSSSKLTEMLTLPDSECQLITERTTIKEIRDLKNFDKEQSVADAAEDELTPLQKCIRAFFEDKKEVLNKVLEIVSNAESDADFKEAYELVNPGEYGTFKKGIIYVFMYDYQTGVKYKSMIEPLPVSLSWAEFLIEIKNCYPILAVDGNTWEIYYHEEEKIEKKTEEEIIPHTEENSDFESSVATSQQTPKTEEITAKSEQKKEVVPKNEEVVPKNEDFLSEINEEEADEQEDKESQGRGIDTEVEKREVEASNSDSEELSTGEAKLCTNSKGLSTEEKSQIWYEIVDKRLELDKLTSGNNPDLELSTLEKAYKAAIDVAVKIEKLLIDKKREV